MTNNTNRCGDCALCCYAPPIAELGKPAGAPCPHMRKGSCAIWSTRPVTCRRFVCLWRANPQLPDALRPDRCGCYFEPLRDRPVVLVMVDPLRPESWKTGPAKALIDKFAAQGTAAAIVGGARNHFVLPEGAAFVPVWKHILEAAKAAGVQR